jgi:hypothetical protein
MANTNENTRNVFNTAAGTVPYSKIKANVEPYVKSRVWAARVRRSAIADRPNINASNKRPTKKMVLLALAQALGVRYTTTGRGGGLEDAPFIPGVSAIPTIQRELWSTEVAYMPVAKIREVMNGHWGIDNLSNNIARNPLSNSGAPPREETLTNGAISSFYHPAFTQVCYGNGEWLINGFKVQKPAVIKKAATILGRTNANITNGPNFLVGTGSKGTIAAEADITKITILNWPGPNSQNYSKTRIIFTIGEDKVGPGEGAQAHGKEVAQLRFIIFAIYYMWREIHMTNYPHPWKNIPIQNITLEAVFLAAGAGSVQNTIITNQARQERTGILAPNSANKKIINVVPINLDKFCAIFRLDAYRFAEAMTAVDRKFRQKMIEYFQDIEKLNRDPSINTLVNNSSPINVSAGLATLKLNNATLRRPFKPVFLREPRANSKNNVNRKQWEIKWLNKYKNLAVRTTLRQRPGLNAAEKAFGKAINTRNNVASYYSGKSNVERLERNYRESLFKKNQNAKEELKAAEAAARVAAAAEARKAAVAAGETKELRTARATYEKALEEFQKKKQGTKVYNVAKTELNKAKARLNTEQAKYNAQRASRPNLSNEAINAIINSVPFEKAYKDFRVAHLPFLNNIKARFGERIGTRMSDPNENKKALASILKSVQK